MSATAVSFPVPTESAAFSPLNDVWERAGKLDNGSPEPVPRQSQFIRWKTEKHVALIASHVTAETTEGAQLFQQLLLFVLFSLCKFYMIL